MTQGPSEKAWGKGGEQSSTQRSSNHQYAVPHSKQSISSVVASNPELVLLSLRTLGSLLCQRTA